MASEEQRAAKEAFKAISRTPQGRIIAKNLEKELYIHKLPDQVKDAAVLANIIINQRIVLKWEF